MADAGSAAVSDRVAPRANIIASAAPPRRLRTERGRSPAWQQTDAGQGREERAEAFMVGDSVVEFAGDIEIRRARRAQCVFQASNDVAVYGAAVIDRRYRG